MKAFEKVLIANRGEIAVRVIRACQEMGIASVAVFSEADRDALHVQAADEAFLVGPAEAAKSYLDVGRLLEVLATSGADAVHPGYGFLAENAGFARAVEEAGATFIGPPASAIDAMGSKTSARALMQEAGVPIVPGTTEPVATYEDALRIANDEIGFPVAVKAVAGGGGKGFRVAPDEGSLRDAFEGASREGEKFFSDRSVYLERYLHNPRHIEVQILADRHGNVIHLGERDCSIQRRHQKLVEEAPAPSWIVDHELRERIGKIGIDAARAVDYVGAGTVEGILCPATGEYFFLEMNTRVQVEHCVTEMVTGVDIVKQGIRAAAGHELSYRQEDIVLRGHAIECRINAEDAAANFAPSPGRISTYREPAGPGVRVDSGVGPGSEISPFYDPMVAKLIVWDADREQATARMLRALADYEIGGLRTLIPFHQALLARPEWAEGSTCHDLLADREWLGTLAFPAGSGDDGVEGSAVALEVEVGGARHAVRVFGLADALTGLGAVTAAPRAGDDQADQADGDEEDEAVEKVIPDEMLTSPMLGNVWKMAVEQGDAVQAGQVVCIIEAMKMENEIVAHRAGTITEVHKAPGDSIRTGDPIVLIS